MRVKYLKIGGLWVAFAYPIHIYAESNLAENVSFSANLMNLGMYSQESTVDDHFTNAASLFLNSTIKLKTSTFDAGRLNIQYTFNGLNNDAQLNTSTNWMGGVGSYVGGAIALNDLVPSQLSQLTWEKQWNDDLSTSVGRTNLRRYFLYNNCQNAVLCTDPIKSSMGSLPLPYGYWGGYLKYNISNNIYFQSGLFEVNTSDYSDRKRGLDFSFDHNLGYTQVYSLGYKDKKSKAEVLYFYNDSEYTNKFSKNTYTGTDGFNFRFNHEFDNNNLPSVYGAYSNIFNKNQPYSNYWELGLSYKINDQKNHLGLKFGQSKMNDDYVLLGQSLNGNNHKTTSFLSIDTDINYSKLTFSPFVQYIWNPDNYYSSKGESFNSNVVVGLLTQFKIF